MDEKLVNLIEKFGVDEVKVRSPLSCETRYGLCAKCYGRDLGRGSLVNVGESVGVIAAQSIERYAVNHENFPHWRSGIRTAVESGVGSKSSGTVRFSSTMRYVTNSKEPVVISRSGEVLLLTALGGKRAS